jgi:flagellar motor switch protein FliN
MDNRTMSNSNPDQDIKTMQERRVKDYEAGFNAAVKEFEDFLEVPLTVNVIVGQKKVRLKELLDFAPGSLLVLDRSVRESMLIYLGDTFFARGEVAILGDTSGVRITEISDPGKV